MLNVADMFVDVQATVLHPDSGKTADLAAAASEGARKQSGHLRSSCSRLIR